MKDIRKIFIAVIAVTCLSAYLAMWITGAYHAGGAITTYYGICGRLGPVALMAWLAWDHIIKLPAWMLDGLPIIIVAAMINRRLLFIAIPAALFLAFLRCPIFQKLRSKKNSSKKTKK
ncbi:MAG: hypothetical protein Q4C96_05570 [Planctomycetia bacterium]|nr:hypothetical protein [Planctomycetia bacterium]